MADFAIARPTGIGLPRMTFDLAEEREEQWFSALRGDAFEFAKIG